MDDSRPGGEPGIIVDASGRVFVNAPPGLPGPSSVWRSTDGGQSFAFAGPGTVGASPNGAGVDVGGGDSNLASDAQNSLYFIDLWLGNSSAAASHDSGTNWFAQPFGTVPIQDRPWISADPAPSRAGTVYSVTEQLGTGLFISIAKPLPLLSGLVYVTVPEITDQARGLTGTAPAGNMATNQKGDTYNVYSIFTGANGSGIGLSKLANGATATTNSTVTPANNAHDQTQAFPVVAVDNGADDNLYVVWTDPVSSSQWDIRFASFNGSTWSNAVTVGHGLYPWVTADAPGKVDIGWYSAARGGYIGDPNVGATAKAIWDVDFAQSVNALASTPTFSSPIQAATGAKSGNVCTKGTGCSADRDLLDFMSITNNAAGDALISYTTVPNPGTGLIRVVVQNGGPTIN
ncbi:MAG TPA: hypothetical protein VE243_02240 [Candidatus Acidoferrum sp.]|nr:hypothetical protein [Candidatus Acidoferrum sp.]